MPDFLRLAARLLRLFRARLRAYFVSLSVDFMSTIHSDIRDPGLLASLLAEDVFQPAEPQSLEQTGVSVVVIETLILKYLLQIGSTSGRDIAQHLCLPFGILEDLLLALRSRQVVVHQGQAAVGDYCYALTEV